MTDCIDEILSVATIYSPTKKRYLPHIVRWQNKLLRVTEVGFRQFIDDNQHLINIHDVVAESGLQLALNLNTSTHEWSVEMPHHHQ